MPWYSLSTAPLIDFLRQKVDDVWQVWLADDASAAGKIEALYRWYQALIEEGKKYGYLVNLGKCWLILKNEDAVEKAKDIFGDMVNITTEGKRHLGAVLGSSKFHDEYCDDLVSNWVKELTVLCEIAKTKPQCAYTAYVKGYRSKFAYFLRTISNFSELLSPVDNLISETFIPTLFGTSIQLEDYREILSLNISDGGMGIKVLQQEAQSQYEASRRITQPHVQSIISQDQILRQKDENGKTAKELKREVRSLANEKRSEKRQHIIENSADSLKRCILQAQEKGASAWLNAVPIPEQKFDLNKQQFYDALNLRYNLPLSNLPATCACGAKFDIVHSQQCKMGGFIHQRHDALKNLTASHLNKVCLM